jgi:hypothetical protein
MLGLSAATAKFVSPRQLGGQLRERERIATINPGLGSVRATGRRIDTSGNALRWIGLKAHARQAPLTADLEMHFVPDGYVGLCRLGGGEVNVCGLFAVRGLVPKLGEHWPEILRGPVGSALRECLQAAEFITDSFCAVSGLNLRPALAVDIGECCLGDALSMIPPVTGNGMSMAFELAPWAAGPLTSYSRGELGWERTRHAIARRCGESFAPRLWWGSCLQAMLMRRSGREVSLALGNRFDWLWRTVFEHTR